MTNPEMSPSLSHLDYSSRDANIGKPVQNQRFNGLRLKVQRPLNDAPRASNKRGNDQKMGELCCEVRAPMAIPDFSHVF